MPLPWLDPCLRLASLEFWSHNIHFVQILNFNQNRYTLSPLTLKPDLLAIEACPGLFLGTEKKMDTGLIRHIIIK
jgi:hypothetical protein